MRAVLVDENFPRSVAVALATAGHDVESVAALAPGLDDIGVLSMARTSRRWLLSFDADFGELIFHRSIPPPPAVLFFRIHPVVVGELLDLALHALDDVQEGSFCVVTREGTRVRPFPAGPQVLSAPNTPSSDGRG